MYDFLQKGPGSGCQLVTFLGRSLWLESLLLPFVFWFLSIMGQLLYQGVSVGVSDVVTGYSGINSIKIGVNGNVTDFFTGINAWTDFYNRKLSSGEVLQNYNAIKDYKA